MRFEDSIFIEAPCDLVYAFFEKMDENYLNWHPEHLRFEWRNGKGLKVGNVFYFEEEIGGQLLKKETRFTEIISNQYIEFKMVNWFYRWFIPKMTFIFDEKKRRLPFHRPSISEGYRSTWEVGSPQGVYSRSAAHERGG